MPDELVQSYRCCHEYKVGGCFINSVELDACDWCFFAFGADVEDLLKI